LRGRLPAAPEDVAGAAVAGDGDQTDREAVAFGPCEHARSLEIQEPLLDAELPGLQTIRRRKTLHFQWDAPELCLSVRTPLVGLGADQLYAVPVFDGDPTVGCALLGLKGDEPLGSAVQEELSDAITWLAQDHRVRRVREGAKD
jgi:hypothetical protein